MSIIELVKNFFKQNIKVAVLDTSAISTHLLKFFDLVEDQTVEVVVPEIVTNEISNGKGKFEVCREADKFIVEARRTEKLKIYTTPDKMRAWPADEQIVAIANIYRKKGYDVDLITCDKNMALRAENQGISVICWNGKANDQTEEKTKTELPKTDSDKDETIKHQLKYVTQNPEPTKNVCKVRDEIEIPCCKVSGKIQISVKGGVAVHSPNGKRKIPNNLIVGVEKDDTVVVRGYSYRIKGISDNTMYLKKIECS